MDFVVDVNVKYTINKRNLTYTVNDLQTTGIKVENKGKLKNETFDTNIKKSRIRNSCI